MICSGIFGTLALGAQPPCCEEAQISPCEGTTWEGQVLGAPVLTLGKVRANSRHQLPDMGVKTLQMFQARVTPDIEEQRQAFPMAPPGSQPKKP